VLEPYQRMGYELAGTFDEHQIGLDDLPAVGTEGLPRVELADVDRDLDAIRAAYRCWVRSRNGAIEPDADFWRDRVIVRPWDEAARAVVIRDGDDVTGFAAFTRSPDPSGHLGEIGFGLRCSMFFTTNDLALRAFLAYARGYRGVGRWLRWGGAPNDPLTLLVGVQAVADARRYRWMLRILDVPAAFEGRGYPGVDAGRRSRWRTLGIRRTRVRGTSPCPRAKRRSARPITTIGGRSRSALCLPCTRDTCDRTMRSRSVSSMRTIPPLKRSR
jgi:predicted acetyltransferase